MPSITIPANNSIVFPAGTTLPGSSAEKLVRLETELADWTSLTGTTVERLRDLEEQTIVAQQRLADAERADNQTWVQQVKEAIEGLMGQRRALSPILATRNARAAEVTAVFVNLRAWASKLTAGTRFEAASDQAVGSKPVTADRVEIIRSEIAKLEAERSAVEMAPPSAEELKGTIANTVAELAAGAGPNLARFLKGKGPIAAPNLQKRWGAVGVVKFDGEFDGLSLLAWLDPEGLIARLSAEIDASRKDPAAELTEADRSKRLADISVQLLALERQEEALIEAAKGQGVDIARRPSASPLALLGIVIGAKSFTGGEAMQTPKVIGQRPNQRTGEVYGLPTVERAV